jgi:hypothetical protein
VGTKLSWRNLLKLAVTLRLLGFWDMLMSSEGEYTFVFEALGVYGDVEISKSTDASDTTKAITMAATLLYATRNTFIVVSLG